MAEDLYWHTRFILARVADGKGWFINTDIRQAAKAAYEALYLIYDTCGGIKEFLEDAASLKEENQQLSDKCEALQRSLDGASADICLLRKEMEGDMDVIIEKAELGADLFESMENCMESYRNLRRLKQDGVPS
jgi:hypothetical protein